jgi:hypothetical protein
MIADSRGSCRCDRRFRDSLSRRDGHTCNTQQTTINPRGGQGVEATSLEKGNGGGGGGCTAFGCINAAPDSSKSRTVRPLRVGEDGALLSGRHKPHRFTAATGK